jgi:uncharacterized protein (DUF1330 family)
MTALTLAVLLKVPAQGVADFQAYEALVLPLIARHGGEVERRLRNGDGTAELHVLRFPSRTAFEAFRADPRRADAAPLLARSGATAEMHEMKDVGADA